MFFYNDIFGECVCGGRFVVEDGKVVWFFGERINVGVVDVGSVRERFRGVMLVRGVGLDDLVDCGSEDFELEEVGWGGFGNGEGVDFRRGGLVGDLSSLYFEVWMLVNCWWWLMWWLRIV